MTVEIRCEASNGRGFVRALHADAHELMRLASVTDHELSVVLVGDRAMRNLNRRFRGKDRPTDVLSFSQIETAASSSGRRRLPTGYKPGDALHGRGEALGDIVISLDTAKRQAQRAILPTAARLRTLLIHGFLHLLGYDHERSRTQAKIMFAREAELEAAMLKMHSRRTRRSRAQQS